MPERIAADFLPDVLPDSPMPLVARWLDEAKAAALVPNPNAMTLATAAGDQPTARIVLCKGLDAAQGVVDFYTNYHSRKGAELDANPRAALVFHWDHHSRQVRIEGPVVRAPSAQSDAYFAGRPRKSQLGAWASDQSRPIDSRAAMVDRFESVAAEYDEEPVPRPPHWGGYRVWAQACELWVEGAGRVHDRARYERDVSVRDGEIVTGDWRGTRLQP